MSLLSPASSSISAVQGVGFKDWSLVCDALDQGRQSLILRKGGIAEGRQGFRFKHEAFFLFPTQYHQQAARVRPEELAFLYRTPPPPTDTVSIYNFFALEWAEWIHDWETIARLTPFHVWNEEILRERFAYGDEPGLQCAFGRVYRLGSAWTFPDKPSYGGCRSWVTLPEFPASLHTVSPVLADAAHEARAEEVRQVLGH